MNKQYSRDFPSYIAFMALGEIISKRDKHFLPQLTLYAISIRAYTGSNYIWSPKHIVETRQIADKYAPLLSKGTAWKIEECQITNGITITSENELQKLYS